MFNPAAVPDSSGVPPVAAAYQSIVKPAAAVAATVTLPDPQLVAELTLVGAAGKALIVAATAVLVADTQPELRILVWA